MIGKDLLKKSYKDNCTIKWTFALSILFVIILFISLYLPFVQRQVGGDTVSDFYPAKLLIENNTLNMWNDLNDKYDTYYFKLPFTDEVIESPGHSYPAQTVWSILLSSIAITFFGDTFFFYINILSSAIIIFFLIITLKKLFKVYNTIFIPILILITFPIFVFWSVVNQNIILGGLFFTAGLYFIISYFEDQMANNKIYLLLSGALIFISVLIKPFFVILLIPTLIYLISCSLRGENRLWKNLFIFFVPILILFAGNLIFNHLYFNNPLFLGYLRGDYHPLNTAIQDHGSNGITQKFFLKNLDIPNIIETFAYFGHGMINYSLVLLFSFLVSCLLMLKEKEKPNLLYFFLISLILFLTYLSTIKNILWSPPDPNFKFSLSLPFFRYLLPIFLIAIVISEGLWKKIFSLFDNKKIKMCLLFLIVIILVLNYQNVITYNGGANLNWYKESTTKISNYSETFNSLLQKGAIIFYPQRYELAFAYPEVSRYNWFYYDGIPPQSRIEETNRVATRLLEDNYTIYIGLYGDPYLKSILNKKVGDPDIIDVFNSLNESFSLVYVNGSYFDRFSFSLYKISKYEKNNSAS